MTATAYVLVLFMISVALAIAAIVRRSRRLGAFAAVSTAVLLAYTGLLFVAVNAWQQPGPKAIVHPDFSGTWTSEAPGLTPAVEGRGNRRDGELLVGTDPPRLVISQDSDKLNIEEHRIGSYNDPVNTLEYRWNGEAIKCRFMVNAPHSVPSEVTSKWEGEKLVSIIAVSVPGESDLRRYTETLSINSKGILAVRLQRVGSADSRTTLYQKVK